MCRKVNTIQHNSKVRWEKFYAGAMKLNHNRGQNFKCFQNNSIHNFKTIGDETLYQELPPTHTHRHAYVHTHRSKKVIFASIYPNEMATLLAMYIIILRVNIH